MDICIQFLFTHQWVVNLCHLLPTFLGHLTSPNSELQSEFCYYWEQRSKYAKLRPQIKSPYYSLSLTMYGLSAVPLWAGNPLYCHPCLKVTRLGMQYDWTPIVFNSSSVTKIDIIENIREVENLGSVITWRSFIACSSSGVGFSCNLLVVASLAVTFMVVAIELFLVIREGWDTWGEGWDAWGDCVGWVEGLYHTSVQIYPQSSLPPLSCQSTASLILGKYPWLLPF